MKYIPVLLIQLILFLGLSCAKQTSPTGGPKDTIPPTLSQAIPKNKSVNFRSSAIHLTFDEMVIINNPREQLIITPSIGKDIQMTARKKSVTLELNTDLQDSTTYTINFRESIQDATEKNPARNLQYAFSTGSYLDSLSIEGSVYELLTGKEVKDATIALYFNPDTFNVFKHKPPYLTKSDDKGNFLIENLKPGRYFIYAFTDKNKNIIVDSRSERYGFLANPIDLKPDQKSTARVPILPLDARELKLISARPNNTYFNIRTSKSLSSYSIGIPGKKDSLIFHNYGEDQSNIRVYMPFFEGDSTQLHFTANDTLGTKLDTILYAKLSTRKATPEKFQLSPLTNPIVRINKSHFIAEIKTNKPIVYTNYDSINYQIDSLNIIPFSSNDIEYDMQTGILRLSKPISKEFFEKSDEENRRPDIRKGTSTPNKLKYNKFKLGRGAFISADLDSSNRIQENVTILNAQNTGTMLVEVSTNNPAFVVQLLSRDFKLNRQELNSKSIVFDNIPPGDYYIRLIIDENENGNWDAGNFFIKKEPESIVFYKNDDNLSLISLKANWELGPLLITYPDLVDKP